MTPSSTHSTARGTAAMTVLALIALFGGCRPTSNLEESFDFVSELPYAEVFAETSRIDFGTPSAHVHLVAGWSGDHTWRDGSTMQWSLGDSSSLRIYLSEPRPLALRFSCRPFPFPGAPAQTVAISVNDQKLTEVKLRGARDEYVVEVPATALSAGENRIELRYGYHRRPVDVRKNAKDQRSLGVAWFWMTLEPGPPAAEPAASTVDDGPALLIPFAHRVSYAFLAPEQAMLSIASLDLWREKAGPGSESQLQVEIRTEGGSRTVELPVPSTRHRLPLDVPAGQPVQLSFVTVRGRNQLGVRVHRPELLSAPAAERPPCAATPPWLESGPANIVVYLIDTLRADHLGAYGYPLEVSPRIDRFARDGVLYSRAVAQSAFTRAAVGSIFTGLTPQLHGALVGTDALDGRRATMASLLRDAGFATAGFTTNGMVSPTFGFDSGFDQYEHLREQDTAEVHHLADALNEHGLNWLRERPVDRPFFLHLHATDPHGPYMPREPFRARFAAGADPSLGTNQAIWDRKKVDTADAETIRDVTALYDAEVAFVDSEFGRFLDELERLDLYDPTLILLVSDHGEEFMEHGSWTHSNNLFAETTHVPLIVKFPDQWRGGSVVKELAQHVDLLPTLLEASGLEIPAVVQGSSLLPDLLCPDLEAPAREVYTYMGGEGFGIEASSITARGMTLIRYSSFPKPRPRVELYDLAEDPGQTRDLTELRPVEAAYLLARLRRYELEAARGASEAPTAEIDPELRERLEAVGYLQ